MRREVNALDEFIRRHCGSVAIEAPSGRATGAQRHTYCRRPVFRKPVGFHFHHPAGQVFPSGMCLLPQLRLRRKRYVN